MQPPDSRLGVNAAMRGSLLVYQLFDVCEAIRMADLARHIGVTPARRDLPARQTPQAQVWFEPPPLVRPLGRIEFQPGEWFDAEVHYHSYGVVCLRLERAFDLDWPGLIELSSRWISAPAVEAAATDRIRSELEEVSFALVNRYEPHLSEDYAVIRLDPLTHGSGTVVAAADLLAQCGAQIAQIVRGDPLPLAADEQAHVLASRLSYYPADLIVTGWTAAFLYDTADGAEATIQLIEYANTQLLEFRFYDEQLSRTLGEVYRLLDEGTGFWRRWRLASEAERLNTIRLDVHELTERADNAAKFLSDMFAARLYRLVAEKVGVPDYRRLVDDKLTTARDLYHFMTERVHQSSALILETMVVIILIIDLIFLFRGKPV
jgi:hypothetical protein